MADSKILRRQYDTAAGGWQAESPPGLRAGRRSGIMGATLREHHVASHNGPFNGERFVFFV